LTDLIYSKLRKGRSLAGLGLERADGRMYVEGLVVPQPEATGEEVKVRGLTFGIFRNVQHIWRRKWENLHFVNCKLNDLGLFGCTIRNCRFERCDMRNVGFWRCRVSDCSFNRCDMRSVAFGGCLIGWRMRRNEFRSVDFERCNLTTSAHSYELYKDCSFKHCRYGACNFRGAVFEDCYFEGKLDSAMFASRDPHFPKMPENELLRTDFRSAGVSQAAFDNIGIDPSWFPVDDDLIILHHGAEDWRRWLSEGYVEPTEGTVWFIEEMARCSGTPSIFSKSLLTNRATFTEDQVEALIAISEGRAPKAPNKR
jgi:fluoroquinolone resistance protein